ncbi:MAG: serine hydrolase [Chitinivibrionales bacterium]|nr:serine hydrolase [Chitinivibrionales bacterium]MBD3397423.1 serine hydrolase [Chitinivibrionales bacterium]
MPKRIHTKDIAAKLYATLASAIENRVFPGAVAGIVSRSGNRTIVPAGHHTYNTSSTAVTEQSIFDVASITKSIPTATLALMAVESGKISLHTRLTEWVPEYEVTGGNSVTVRHLLTQTVDHGYSLASCKGMTPQDLLHLIFTRDYRLPAGERFCYTNTTSILLGMLVERVLGAPLDVLARDMLFAPLGMERTTFSPQTLPQNEILPTEHCDWRGRVVQAEVHDESAFVLRKIMVPGSAGLFSTAPDLLNFLEMLLNGGRWKNMRVFPAALLELMYHNQLERIGRWAGLGWELNQLRFMGLHCSAQTIGKTGFTGCVVLCDFEKGRALAFLSNHTFPKRRGSRDAINAVRRDIADIVFEG